MTHARISDSPAVANFGIVCLDVPNTAILDTRDRCHTYLSDIWQNLTIFETQNFYIDSRRKDPWFILFLARTNNPYCAVKLVDQFLANVFILHKFSKLCP